MVLDNYYFQIGLKIGGVLISAIVLRFILGFYFKRAEKKINKKGSEEIKRVKLTRIDLLRKLASVGIFTIAFIFILFFFESLRQIAISLLAGAGVLAIVVGFAAQKTLANIVSGISIALYAPFRIGDKLKIVDEYGVVESLTLRHTVIQTWDNKRIVIPNSLIDEKEIVNYSLKGERILWTLNMGISYDSDIDKAREIMLKLANNHKDNLIFKENGEEKKPLVRVTGCGDFAINMRLYFWAEDVWKAWVMGYDLTESIKKEFDKVGIEIPFPYRTIVYKKDLDKK